MPTNEEIIRTLYKVAEEKDVAGFVKLFTDDGYFYDVSAGQKYYGQDIGKTVEITPALSPTCTASFTTCTPRATGSSSSFR